MSDFEEEIYSTMFTSLKHSIRRKILRMLSNKPRSFSEILKSLAISSSHLTYHLENLGELVSKIDDGKYKLSTFGEAAVATMSKVEEVQKAERFSSLPIKWKSFFVVLIIGLVVLAGVSYAQYQSLNTLSFDNEQFSAENEKLNGLNLFLESKYEKTLKDFCDLEQLYQETQKEFDYFNLSYQEALKDFDNLELLHHEALKELLQSVEFTATFTGDISGTGRLVEVEGYFLTISSNVVHNDVKLSFNSSTFGDFAGTHVGYLHMRRSSTIDPTVEIFYTYGPENDLFYQLHGFGTFEGPKTEWTLLGPITDWFRINTTGHYFTLYKSGEATEWEWVFVWEGFPSFTVQANNRS